MLSCCAHFATSNRGQRLACHQASNADSISTRSPFEGTDRRTSSTLSKQPAKSRALTTPSRDRKICSKDGTTPRQGGWILSGPHKNYCMLRLLHREGKTPNDFSFGWDKGGLFAKYPAFLRLMYRRSTSTFRSKTMRQSRETDRRRSQSSISHEFEARPVALKLRDNMVEKNNMESTRQVSI